MICPICKQEIKDNSKFCGKCGNIVPRCTTCGKVIDRKLRFCVYDGTPVPEEIQMLFGADENENSLKTNVKKVSKKKRRWIPVSLFLIIILIIGVILFSNFMIKTEKIPFEDRWIEAVCHLFEKNDIDINANQKDDTAEYEEEKTDETIEVIEEEDTYLAEEITVHEENVTAEETAIAVSESVISSVTATSYLEEKEYNIKHLPEFVVDGDLNTAWVEGKDDQGVGETIVLNFNEDCVINGFLIYAGYQKSSSLYEKNSRPSLIEVFFSDGSTEEFVVYDINGEQKITLSSPRISNSVSFTILDVYSGDTYTDTAISEISLF